MDLWKSFLATEKQKNKLKRPNEFKKKFENLALYLELHPVHVSFVFKHVLNIPENRANWTNFADSF